MKYCKYLDREKKGYVTVGDVGTFVGDVGTFVVNTLVSIVIGAAFILAGALISLIILVVYVSEIKISECDINERQRMD